MDDTSKLPKDCPTAKILSELVSQSQVLTKAVNDVNGILRSHMHDHDMNQKALEQIVGSIRLELAHTIKGFPNDDPKSHREYHELRIEQTRNKAEFWSKMTFELSKWGLVGFIGWALVSLWQTFIHGPK